MYVVSCLLKKKITHDNARAFWMWESSVFKQMFEPGLVPTILAKSSKHSASNSGKEGILPTAKRFNFKLKDDDMALCPRTPWLTRRSACNFSRAGGRPETCAFQATKCPQNSAYGRSRAITKRLCQFSTEACKIDGKPYPPKTLAALFDGNPTAYSETEREPDQPNADINVQDFLDNWCVAYCCWLCFELLAVLLLICFDIY